MGKHRKTLVTREDVLTRSTSEYEALVAIAKEARRLNAVPGLHLKGEEKAIPKAVENFVKGRVEYEVDGVPASELLAEAEAAAVAAKSGKSKSRASARTGRKAKAAGAHDAKATKRRPRRRSRKID